MTKDGEQAFNSLRADVDSMMFTAPEMMPERLDSATYALSRLRVAFGMPSIDDATNVIEFAAKARAEIEAVVAELRATAVQIDLNGRVNGSADRLATLLGWPVQE